jgi:undecaprenyl-diphosphatase
LGFSETNENIFRMINNLGKEYPFLNPAWVFIAEHVIFVLGLVAITFWFTGGKKNRGMVICAVMAGPLAVIIGKIAGLFHSNYQPFAELANVNQLIEKTVGNSFPSDHTILVFSFCVTFWLFQKGWGFLWLLLAALVGISRIWVGVHYPADVLAGALISTLTAAGVYALFPKLGLAQKYIKEMGL